MSNYRDLAVHPETGNVEVADWACPPGLRLRTVTFADGYQTKATLLPPGPDPVALFEAGQKMAEALDLLSDANETLDPGDYELWEHSAAMCIKSGDIREAAEALSAWRGITRETKDG